MGEAFTPAEANLRERVTDRIRLGIVSGEIGPGAMLSAPALSKALGISTTPVRKALLQLSSDGLLRPRRNRGFRVVDATLEELRNVFEVRVQLETFALVSSPGRAWTTSGNSRRARGRSRRPSKRVT